MSSYAIPVLSLLMDNQDGILITEIKRLTIGKTEKTGESFDRMMSDLLGMGCAYICRYDNHIPVIRLQKSRFQEPHAVDTYTGIEVGRNERRYPGLRYRVVYSIEFEGKKMSAWAATQMAKVTYSSLWNSVHETSGPNPKDSDFQREFDRILARGPMKTKTRNDPKNWERPRAPTVFANLPSVFQVTPDDTRFGSNHFVDASEPE